MVLTRWRRGLPRLFSTRWDRGKPRLYGKVVQLAFTSQYGWGLLFYGGGEGFDPGAAALLGRVEGGVGLVSQHFHVIFPRAISYTDAHTHGGWVVLTRTQYALTAHY